MPRTTTHAALAEVGDVSTQTGSRLLILGEVADFYGVRTWQVARLFERRLVSFTPLRAGRYRVVTEEQLPAIETALRKAGYLPPADESAEPEDGR
jgi:hypothetical protein